MSHPEAVLKELFQQQYSTSIDHIEALAQSGSYRQYYRIYSNQKSVLGVFNTDLQENKAYLSFTKTFSEANIAVPEVYLISENKEAYLVQDLGQETLFDSAQIERKKTGELSAKNLELYELTLEELLKIQTQTINKLDLSYCYPRNAFDKQSILWDLNYFKYFFLRLMRVTVDEQKLEDDIQKLAFELDKVDQNFFLYRDFQSRNVMIKEGNPYFIDYQGGRRGSFYYDIASLLYDANVELVESDRSHLLNYYYNLLKDLQSIDENEFNKTFSMFAIIRLTQALGAFGLRGVIEKKPNFKECIPYALKSLKTIIEASELTQAYPTLCQSFTDAYSSKHIRDIVNNK